MPKEEETKLISIEFMEKISQNGKMDICVPSHSVQFIVERPEYIEGYRKMKSRGIKIRVITEITIENMKFCINIIENNMIDEIRHLTGVTCGIAVREDQYMTAFLSNTFNEKDNPHLMSNAMYSTEKKLIEQGQAIFDMLWENAIPIFKN